MNAAVVGATPNAGLAHNNIMPSLCVNYIIALNGLYPQRP
jgi:microcystin-dependent protein